MDIWESCHCNGVFLKECFTISFWENNNKKFGLILIFQGRHILENLRSSLLNSFQFQSVFCFSFKNFLVYNFFLEEENLKHLWSKYQVKQIPKLHLAPDRILVQYIPKTSFVYHDMKEKEIYVEITSTEIIMKPIMLPQWDINVSNFKHAIWGLCWLGKLSKLMDICKL